MPQKRPLGVNIIASLITMTGGFGILVIFLSMIDSIRSYGMASILINTLESFAGFIFYGALPILFYSTGIGLFTGRFWAYYSLTRIIPLIMFFYCIHMALTAAQRMSLNTGSNPLFLFQDHAGLFIGVLFRYLLILGPVLIYFNRPEVRDLYARVSPKDIS